MASRDVHLGRQASVWRGGHGAALLVPGQADFAARCDLQPVSGRPIGAVGAPTVPSTRQGGCLRFSTEQEEYAYMGSSYRDTAITLTSQVFAKARITRALDQLNSRRGGIILAFHEISHGQLSKHLAQVSERYTFISLSEFVSRLAQGKSTSRLAVITFDDGYGPAIESAAHLAQLHGWPMTFFLPTRYLDTREPYWYQELTPLLERATCEYMTVEDRRLSLRDQASLAKTLDILSRRFRSLSSFEEVNALLRSIRYALLGSEERPADLPTSEPIPWKRVRELVTREELSFEAHSVNHLALSRLTEEAVRGEMMQSRACIEQVTGRKVQHFCYPYGGLGEIGALAPRIARSLFSSATTMLRGRCHKDADPAMLSRIPLYEHDLEQRVALKVSLAR
jgi:peptidoglycan/xylan/chitin deacetylase (PgdA/CDA1 family)